LAAAFTARFKSFVSHRAFPCVGAKSALNRDRMEFGIFKELSDVDAAASLCDQLGDFSRRHPVPGADPVSFVAMFRGRVANEDEFHSKLWEHLQAMHDIDAEAHPWDASVSADPANDQFSFSVGSRAFFVVGLHPKSSRLARQAPFPCLVFNFHDQFESMRQSGRYETLQKAIRQRDVALQGDINPVLARFGEGSEAAQYSGNAAAAGQRCPFRSQAA
jgi:FPC/CPF motif-containing protein YcgG